MKPGLKCSVFDDGQVEWLTGEAIKEKEKKRDSEKKIFKKKVRDKTLY